LLNRNKGCFIINTLELIYELVLFSHLFDTKRNLRIPFNESTVY